MPAIYLLLLCDVVRRWGLDDQALIEGLGVDRASLLDGQRRVSLQICHTAACRAVALAGDRGLGLAYARALNVTLHGSVGMMALSSPSIGAALDAAARYVTLRAPFLAVSQSRESGRDGEVAVIHVRSLWDLGELDRFIMESMLVGLAHMAQQLLGAPLLGGQIWLTGEPPDYADTLTREMPVPLHYGSESCQLRVPAVLLAAAPRLADPTVAALAQEQCELEFRQLFASVQSVAERLRQLLANWPEGEPIPSLETTAERLHLSSRTLKRRLQEEGMNYRDITDGWLCERACALLEEPRLAVSEIAWRLGYNDVSNFSRAFRRWTGQTPRQWRGVR
ncbi:AraC family transcriptional regulator [Isoalcanivorax indicus]|uniref:AraC family transcriptional regulator n=1 Tax=Isoalcanivorax indicus TaxID=2202653 RepID=UPI001FE7EF63|nr:AraC family transcriptional regulator [Isoalcanivorax indicus]